MALVGGILDGFEQIGVAPGSATIFGWAGSCSFKAQRVFRLEVPGLEPLEQDLVAPVVAEVVFVKPPFLPGALRQQRTQNNLGFVLEIHVEVVTVRGRSA